MLTAEDAAEALNHPIRSLGELTGIKPAVLDLMLVQPEAVAPVLVGIDQQAIWTEEFAKWSWELWDKVSPIVGREQLPAEHWLNIFGDKGEVVLLRGATENDLRFLNHAPQDNLPLTAETAAAVAAAEIQRITTENSNRRVMDIVKQALWPSASP